jgi:hypothetical protein
LVGFLDEAVHVFRCSVQHWDVVEINLVSGVDAVFCNRRFLGLIESRVSCAPCIWLLWTSQSGRCILFHTHREYDTHPGF